MKRLAPYAVLLAALAAAAAETPMKKSDAPAAPAPGDAVAAQWRFAAPEGWRRSDYANAGGVDAVVAFEKGSDRLTLRLFGAPGSFYKTPEAFFAGPAATTMGKAPDRAGSAAVDGRKIAVYSRRYPLADGDPHMVGPATTRFGDETFCVLPPGADGRFLVAAYARESPIPDSKGSGEKAWKKLLNSLKRPTPKKAP